MVVVRDDRRIARLARLAQIASLAGILALVAGLLFIFISDNPNVFLYQLLALVVGYALSQVGLYYAHRYLRRPRMDQVLDKAVGKFARRDGRLYHYILPAPHVLLTPTGIVVIVAKYQTGRISASGDTWRQAGLGMRRFFGREGLGNPSREAATMMARMETFLEKEVPSAADVPMTPLIVFTAPNIDNLDVKESTIPAMHASKVAPFLRAQAAKEKVKPMPKAQYDAIRAAFDARAGGLVESTVDADSE